MRELEGGTGRTMGLTTLALRAARGLRKGHPRRCTTRAATRKQKGDTNKEKKETGKRDREGRRGRPLQPFNSEALLSSKCLRTFSVSLLLVPLHLILARGPLNLFPRQPRTRRFRTFLAAVQYLKPRWFFFALGLPAPRCRCLKDPTTRPSLRNRLPLPFSFVWQQPSFGFVRLVRPWLSPPPQPLRLWLPAVRRPGGLLEGLEVSLLLHPRVSRWLFGAVSPVLPVPLLASPCLRPPHP